MSEHILTCTLNAECPIPDPITYTFGKNEAVLLTYNTYNGIAIFTNKRIFVHDIHGATNKKNSSISIPYASIDMWTITNNSDMDYIMDLYLSAGSVRVIVKKSIKINQIEALFMDMII